MTVYRRPRSDVVVVAVVLTVLAVLVVLARPRAERPVAPERAAAASVSPSLPSVPPSPDPPPIAELPRGGTSIFPEFRLVGFSGADDSPALGRLGIGSLEARVREIERRSRDFDGDRPVLPVLELIAVVVQAHPGDDGRFRVRSPDAQIRRYLDAARRHRALLLLNVQPGRASLLSEVRALSRWLREPDIGVALDPEWAVGPRQTPGRVFGHTTAAELNAVARYLSSVVTEHRLPEKAMVVHQLAQRIISRVGGLKPADGVATVLSVDGIGARADKVATWRRLVKPLPSSVHAGFKLFFVEDRERGELMTPRQVLALRPRPEYVLYE